MAHEIAGSCTCRICGEHIVGPAGIVIRPGGHNNGRAGEYLLKLAQHAISHKDVNKGLEDQALEYLGFLRMTMYSTTDSAISEQRDFLRWKIHQATLAHQLSDESMDAAAKEFATQLVTNCIEGLVVKTGDKFPAFVDIIRPTLELQASTKLLEILTDFRRLIQEPGKYQLSVISTGQAAPTPQKQG
jgi:hypothetical protein